MNAFLHAKNSTQMFIAASFRVARRMETTQLFTNEGMDENPRCSSTEILVTERNGERICTAVCINLDHCAKWQKPHTEGHIFYDFTFYEMSE